MKKDTRICFVGDSFVNGTGDETALGWAGRLCAAANRAHQITYYNLGVRRDTSTDILQRIERECASRLPKGCDNRVVLSFGVNDTVIENYRPRVKPEQSVENLREILKRLSHYRVLLVGPPPVDDEAQNRRIESLSEAFLDEATKLGVDAIELYPHLINDHDYLYEVARNDGAHPRSSGYARMAEIVAASPDWWFR